MILIYWRFSQVAILWLPPCRSCKFVATKFVIFNSWCIKCNMTSTDNSGTGGKFFSPIMYTRVKPDICWTQMLIFCGYIALNLPGSSEYSVSYHHQIPLQQKIIKHFESYWVLLDDFHYPDTLMLFSSCYCVATTMQLQICGYRCVILESWCIKCYIKSFVSNSLVPSVSPFLMQGLM